MPKITSSLRLPLIFVAVDLAIAASLSKRSQTILWDLTLLPLIRATLVCVNCTTTLLHVVRKELRTGKGETDVDSNYIGWVSHLPEGVWLLMWSHTLLRPLLIDELCNACHAFRSIWDIAATTALYFLWRRYWTKGDSSGVNQNKEKDDYGSNTQNLLMLLGNSRPHWQKALAGSALLALSSFGNCIA